MIQTVANIGPQDHGRRMSLAEFDPAEGQEGYLYELSRGMVIVMDVPNLPHMFQVDECRQQLSAYRARHPKRIAVIAAGMECKLLIREYESERHPDVAIYLEAVRKGDRTLGSRPRNKDLRPKTRGPVPFSDSL